MPTAAERAESPAGEAERGAWLAAAPVIATVAYYFLPASLQGHILIQFLPQLAAYAALTIWGLGHLDAVARLGLRPVRLGQGVRWGVVTGLLLGGVNTAVILILVPSWGYDIRFLKGTPHAQIPFWLMVPWFIGAIAFCVELNFRGFLLGRLANLERRLWKGRWVHTCCPLALLVSTATFSFDPFMVHTFRYLHWIAIWDGVIWGAIRLRTGSLWIPILAHAIEVVVLYVSVRLALE